MQQRSMLLCIQASCLFLFTGATQCSSDGADPAGASRDSLASGQAGAAGKAGTAGTGNDGSTFPSAANNCIILGNTNFIEQAPDCLQRKCGELCTAYDYLGAVITLPHANWRCSSRKRCLPTRD